MAEDRNAHWLNRDVLTHVMQSVEEKKDVEVISWKFEPAVPPGLNYQSQLFRVSVEYRVSDNDRSTSIIAKVPLDDEGKSYIDAFNGTQREVTMYHEVLPKFAQLHPWRGAPKALPSPLTDVIIMEDLREQGYRMYPRGELLDFHHCKEVLKNLSTFHAISVRLHHQHLELVESVGQDTRFTGNAKDTDEYWKERLGKFVSLKECTEFAPKIRRNIETFYPSVVEMFKPSMCLNVLTHNDMWINNFMFRYDESGALVDSTLVDFQSPRYCSFAADLIEMWWFSVDVKVRELYRDELFEVYRQNLNKTLEEVNCLERVTKEEFDNELKRFSPYSLKPVLDYVGGERFRKELPILLKQMDEFEWVVKWFERLSKEEFDSEVRRFSPYALRPGSIHMKFSSGDQYLELLPTVLRQMDGGDLLDFHHCKEVLINLSTFHALSVRLHHQCPELIESVGQHTTFNDDSTGSDEQFWKDHLRKFSSNEECDEFATKIQKRLETFYPTMVEVFKPSKCLNVLTHDDMWINNIMFRYDESGALVDSKLLDFQSPRHCSFAADLIMMWWSSADMMVHELHQEELFEVYRENLNKTLEEVNCHERVTKEEFDSEIKRFAPYALRPASIHLQFAVGDRYYDLLPDVLRLLESFGVFQ